MNVLWGQLIANTLQNVSYTASKLTEYKWKVNETNSKTREIFKDLFVLCGIIINV